MPGFWSCGMFLLLQYITQTYFNLLESMICFVSQSKTCHHVDELAEVYNRECNNLVKLYNLFMF